MKDFFHPNKAKVTGTVVIAVLNIGLAMYSAQAILCTHNCPALNTWQSFWAFTIQPFAVVLLTMEFIESMEDFLPELLMVPLLLIICAAILTLFWYLLACVVYTTTYHLKRAS
jgi:hypothetical protein